MALAPEARTMPGVKIARKPIRAAMGLGTPVGVRTARRTATGE